MPDPIIDLRAKQQNEIPPAQHEEKRVDHPVSDALPPHLREEKELLSWEAPEFPERSKHEGRWIRNITISGLILVGVFILLRNLLGAVIVILGAFTLLLQAFKKPKTVRVRVTDKGLKSDDRVWAYEDLESFWIFTEPEDAKTVSLKTKTKKNIPLPLGAFDPIRVRSSLLPFLSEEKQELSGLDLFLKRVGY